MFLVLSILRRVLALVPPALSSRLHTVGLLALGAWLVVLPLIGVAHPSAYQQLIGGNYTNVTSAIGAAIAAGGVVHVARRQDQHTWNLEDLRDSLMHLHQKHNRLVNQLGAAAAVGEQQPPAPTAAAGEPPAAAAPPAGAPQ